MMENTALSPATAMNVETMVMTELMMLSQLPVKMEQTEMMAVRT